MASLIEHIFPAVMVIHQFFKNAEFDEVFKTRTEPAPADRQVQTFGWTVRLASRIQQLLQSRRVAFDVQVSFWVHVRRVPYEIVSEDGATSDGRESVNAFGVLQLTGFVVKGEGVLDAQPEASGLAADRQWDHLAQPGA